MFNKILKFKLSATLSHATATQGAELAVLSTLDSAPELRIDVLMVEAEFVHRGGGDGKINKEVRDTETPTPTPDVNYTIFFLLYYDPVDSMDRSSQEP